MKRLPITVLILMTIFGIYIVTEFFTKKGYTNEDPLNKETTQEEVEVKCPDNTACKEKIDTAVKYLRKSSRILKQERQRWEGIHSNPITDKVKVTQDNSKEMIAIDVIIDTKVENEINNQPITRQYVIDFMPPRRTLTKYVDFMVGVGYVFKPAHGNDFGEYLKDTLRPTISVGVRPFVFLKNRIEALSGLGFAAQSMFFNTGIMMYYSHKAMFPFYLGLTVGWDWKGNTIPGGSIGVRF